MQLPCSPIDPSEDNTDEAITLIALQRLTAERAWCHRPDSSIVATLQVARHSCFSRRLCRHGKQLQACIAAAVHAELTMHLMAFTCASCTQHGRGNDATRRSLNVSVHQRQTRRDSVQEARDASTLLQTLVVATWPTKTMQPSQADHCLPALRVEEDNRATLIRQPLGQMQMPCHAKVWVCSFLDLCSPCVTTSLTRVHGCLLTPSRYADYLAFCSASTPQRLAG